MEVQVTRSEHEALKKQIALLNSKLEAIEIQGENKLQPSSSKSYSEADSSSVISNIGVNGPYSGDIAIEMDNSHLGNGEG